VIATEEHRTMRRTSFRTLVLVTVAVAFAQSAGSTFAQRGGSAAKPTAVTVYKDAGCGCCALWGKHLEQAGMAVTYVNSTDLPAIRAKYKVPGTLQSCHTAVVDGYVVEGHVPAADIRRLLTTRPKVLGIAVPGMPLGSPGMEQGSRRDSYAVMTFDASGKTTIFAEH
jgi:hypothetical protein